MKISMLLNKIYKIDQILNQASSVVNVVVRLFMAKIFFISGLTKIDNWEGTIFLFENEYSVPLLPPIVAATMSTFIELILVPLFVVGFMTRYISICLICMTLVINYSYFKSTDHYYWMMLFAFIAVNGGGYCSVDYWLSKNTR